MKFQAIKGVRDILPPESALWNRVEQAAREVFADVWVRRNPAADFRADGALRALGGLDTDIVSKEMYTFEDYDHRN